MSTTFACPVCRSVLTFMPTGMTLGCPFCRVALQFENGVVPVGQRVRCGKCQGVFTADEPPASLGVPSSSFGMCPSCNVALRVPALLPPGKKIKCPQCAQKFMPNALIRDSAVAFIAFPHAAPVVPGAARSVPSDGRDDAAMPSLNNRHDEPETQRADLSPRAPLAPLADAPPGVENPQVGADGLAQLPYAPETPATVPPPADLLPPPAPSTASTRPKPRTQLVIKPASSRSKTQLAPTASLPAAEVPEPVLPSAEDLPPAAELHTPVPVAEAERDVADEDVLIDTPPVAHRLIGPAAADEVMMPDTQRVAAPPARLRRRPRLKPQLKAKAEAEETRPAEFKRKARPTPAPRAPVSQQFTAPEPPLEVEPSFDDLDTATAIEVTDDTPVPVVEAEPEPAPPPVRMPSPAPSPARPKPMASPLLQVGPKRESSFDVRQVLIIVAIVGGLGGFLYALYALIPWSGQPSVYPTEGSVFFNGKPATGARVTFIPEDKTAIKVFPTGLVGTDGSFKLTTFETDDGAPAGKYKVTVVRGQISEQEYRERSQVMSPAELQRYVKKMAQDPLYKKFANPRNSGLSAEVNRQENKLEPFQLK